MPPAPLAQQPTPASLAFVRQAFAAAPDGVVIEHCRGTADRLAHALSALLARPLTGDDLRARCAAAGRDERAAWEVLIAEGATLQAASLFDPTTSAR